MTLYILSDCLNYGYLRIKQFLEENPNAILYGTTGLALVMLTLEISVFFVPEPRISHCHRHRTGTARRQESKDDDDDGGGDDDENNDDSGNEYVTGDEQDELHEEDCRSFSPQALIKEETPSDVEQINFESQKYYENYAKNLRRSPRFRMGIFNSRKVSDLPGLSPTVSSSNYSSDGGSNINQSNLSRRKNRYSRGKSRPSHSQTQKSRRTMQKLPETLSPFTQACSSELGSQSPYLDNTHYQLEPTVSPMFRPGDLIMRLRMFWRRRTVDETEKYDGPFVVLSASKKAPPYIKNTKGGKNSFWIELDLPQDSVAERWYMESELIPYTGNITARDFEDYKGNDGLFEIDKIRADRLQSGTLEYLISWKGYPSEDDTWEEDVKIRAVDRDIITQYENRKQVWLQD